MQEPGGRSRRDKANKDGDISQGTMLLNERQIGRVLMPEKQENYKWKARLSYHLRKTFMIMTYGKKGLAEELKRKSNVDRNHRARIDGSAFQLSHIRAFLVLFVSESVLLWKSLDSVI